MSKISQKEAIQILMDFYGIETEAGRVTGLATILPDKTPQEVWKAWETLAAKVDWPQKGSE